MTNHGRRSVSLTNSPSRPKKKKNFSSEVSSPDIRKSFTPQRSGERTVRSLRLLRALTVPDSTSISEACRRMAARKVDSLLLTDSNALLCGILTDKDIATRVIAREVNLDETPVSKVMTRNPVFVLSDTLAVEALQKMVQGKFRHLPVVENGEVVAILDIAKCLYDAIARLERAAEKGKAIAAAVEGSNSSFLETLRDQIFKPSLSTIIPEKSKVIIVSPTDTVLATTKKMLELRVSCAVVTVDDKPCGILTSKDILMRVIAQNLPASTTLVDKAMTPNPECAKVDTAIVDALHTMQDGKFLHLPVLDKDGTVVAILDVIHITHAAIATAGQVGNTANLNSEAADSMIQKFWDSAISLSSPNDDDDEDSRSDSSLKIASEGREIGRPAPFNAANMLQQAFSFKVQDRKGRLHRFTCDTRNLTEVIASVSQKVGNDIDADHNLPQIMYEDEEHDKIVLASDSDLAVAVEHAKTAGLKGLRLHLEYSGLNDNQRDSSVKKLLANTNTSLMRPSTYSVVAAGAVILAGLSILAFFRRR